MRKRYIVLTLFIILIMMDIIVSNLNRYAPYYVQQIEVSQDANPLIPIVGQVYSDLAHSSHYEFKDKHWHVVTDSMNHVELTYIPDSGESFLIYKNFEYWLNDRSELVSHSYVDKNGMRIRTEKITPEIRQQMLEQFEEFARPILGTKIKKPIINLQWLYNMLNEDRFK